MTNNPAPRNVQTPQPLRFATQSLPIILQEFHKQGPALHKKPCVSEFRLNGVSFVQEVNLHRFVDVNVNAGSHKVRHCQRWRRTEDSVRVHNLSFSLVIFPATFQPSFVRKTVASTCPHLHSSVSYTVCCTREDL